MLALVVWCVGLAAAEEAEIAYPQHPAVVDVTRAPYSAKGDGVADDTAVLQRALTDHVGRHHILYFPPGTYLISDTLTWPKKGPSGDNWGNTFLQGRSAAKCELRLKDGAAPDAAKPKAIMWCGGFGSADWFHNYVQGLTFNVGKNNPGAVGLQFYSNNTGAVRDCGIVSEDGQGAIGLDLGHRDLNGPLLVRNLRVQGFRRGVVTAAAVNSQTFEHLQLAGQTEVGFDNAGQAISIRGLTSANAVPALRSYGTLCLIEAKLTGTNGAENLPALINYNGGRGCLRDLETAGYGRALADVATPDLAAAFRVRGADKPGSAGPKIAEYFSHPPTSVFPTEPKSLRLPIEETPEHPPEDPAKWAVVDRFGADPTAKRDSAAAIQKALDSGAKTVFFAGHYSISKPLTVRGKVRRIVGTGNIIDYFEKTKPTFRVLAGAEDLTIEHFAKLGGGIINAGDRTLILRSLESRLAGGRGKVFLEDFCSHELKFGKQQVFARQLNVENEGTHVRNDGGDFWALGYKTERGGILLDARRGSRNEILGGFSYTTTAGKLAPMFVNDHAAVFAYFGEVCFNGDPYQTLVKETRGTETKTVPKGAGGTWPYIGDAPAP